jgi:hypothetical protein
MGELLILVSDFQGTVQFNHDSDIMPTEFEELYEKYDSRVYSYITGKIRFDKLLKSAWVKKSEVNIILLNGLISESLFLPGIVS